MKTVRNTSRWIAGAGTLLAILTCYGTVALVALLSVLGISVAIHEGAWAGAISAFAGLAVFGVVLGYRSHRTMGPLALAMLGFALILWAMFGSYNRVVELAGFLMLAIATFWDWRARCERRTPVA